MRLPRPKFSLMTLILLCCAAGSAMGVYSKRVPWVETGTAIPLNSEAQDNAKKPKSVSWPTMVEAKFAPDSKRFVIGENRNNSLYDLCGRSILEPNAHVFRQITFSHDGKWTFVNYDHDTKNKKPPCYEIRENENGKLFRTLSFHGDFPALAALNSKSTYLIDTRNVNIWDIKTGKQVIVLHDGFTRCDTSQKTLIKEAEFFREAFTKSQTATNLIDFYKIIRNPTLVNVPAAIGSQDEAYFHPYSVPVTAIASPDGSIIATKWPDSSSVQLWDGNTLNACGTLQIPSKYLSGFFSSDGRKVFVNDAMGQLIAYDIQSQDPSSILPPIPNTHAYASAWNGNPNILLVNYRGSDPKSEYSHYRVYDVLNDRILAEEPKQWDDIRTLTPDFTRCINNLNEIVDRQSNKCIFFFPTTDFPRASIIAFSPDNQYCLVSSGNVVQLWKRVRPERWWGYFYLPEMWLLIVFSLATLTSLFYKRASPA